MSALLLLLICLALGAAVSRWLRPPLGLAQGLNWWVIHIALPALILSLIPRLQVDVHLWFLVASMWLCFVGAWATAALIGRWQGWTRARIGCVTLMAGLGNTAFMGYPLLEALHGREGLALGVIADQAGCFVALAIGGVAISAWYSGARPEPREIARRILLFPSFMALALGIFVGMLGGWPPVFEEVLTRIGATLTPLALFSVGLRLKLALGGGQTAPLLAALGWKLLLAPVLMLALGSVAGVAGLTLTVGVLQTAMAPMVSAAILADQHQLEPPLANNILGSGILLSLLSVPAWNYWLGF